ncbi:MAG: hypothetical protein EOS73_34790 [Mesorhizobium sp.]|uniref:hypothetical protein n=1 Tax=Mesorhizobium sp. M7A.F.Ca.ET.027.02.1.1 TaxID=2496655 RepID=UPI000FD1BC06|nr:hypothetical protein [Mesorhizobium sp. M7A.F.Ca.ET.027.02.1.1]RVD13953.1 hypothetical protein EN749_21625 [Mesorhizobium sp. M7A.F.Ca.ET.027.02.1.1]RWC94575.1 MAG: hypothetical protein EOS73_34790 [Mesorhizobium sp.]
MSEAHLDPAKSIIAKIGIDNVARVTGKHVSRVYRWMSPKERGGTGGLIPQAAQPVILQFAVENGIDLSPADFFPVAEKAA